MSLLFIPTEVVLLHLEDMSTGLLPHCLLVPFQKDFEPQEDRDHVQPCLFITVSLMPASVPGLGNGPLQCLNEEENE